MCPVILVWLLFCQLLDFFLLDKYEFMALTQEWQCIILFSLSSQLPRLTVVKPFTADVKETYNDDGADFLLMLNHIYIYIHFYSLT
jgi:hypothetical protein